MITVRPYQLFVKIQIYWLIFWDFSSIAACFKMLTFWSLLQSIRFRIPYHENDLTRPGVLLLNAEQQNDCVPQKVGAYGNRVSGNVL